MGVFKLTRIFFALGLSVIASGVVSGMLSGCGKKGEVRPPEAFAPSEVQGIKVMVEGRNVTLQWQAPTTTQEGEDLGDLDHFIVKRTDGGRYVDETDFNEIGVVPVTASKMIPVVGETLPGVAPEMMAVYEFKDRNLKGDDFHYLIVPVNVKQLEGVPGYVRANLRISRILPLGDISGGTPGNKVP